MCPSSFLALGTLYSLCILMSDHCVESGTLMHLLDSLEG